MQSIVFELRNCKLPAMLKRRIVHISFPWLVPKLVRKTNAKQNSSCVFRGPDSKQNTVGGLPMRIQAFICITRFVLTFLEKGWLFKNSKCTLWIFNFFFSCNLYSMLTYCFASQIPTLMIGSHSTYVMKFNNSIKKLLQPINVAEEAQYPISYSLPSFTNPNPKRKTTNLAAFTLLQLSSLPLLYILSFLSPPLPPLNALAELQHVLWLFPHSWVGIPSTYLQTLFKIPSSCNSHATLIRSLMIVQELLQPAHCES